MKTNRQTITAILASTLLFSPVFAAEHTKDEKKTTVATEHAATAEHKAHSDTGKDPMTAHLETLSGSEFEAGFLAMMIHHHDGGVKMAQLAIDKAQSPELKAMAEKMKADQSKEITQMTAWLKEWHKQTPADHKMPGDHMKMMEKDMAELKAAKGAEFDGMFARMMAHHHTGAIEMSKPALAKATHPEVKNLAKNIISSQTEEQEKLMKMSGK